MTLLEKQEKILPYFQLGLFVFLIIFVQYKLFMIAFTILVVFILYLALTSIQERVFSWVMLAYFFGYLFSLYGDRLLEELALSISTIMILNRALMLIPILFTIYVIKKFKGNMIQFKGKTNWDAQIYFPFISRGFHSLSVKYFLVVVILVNLIVFSPFLVKMNFSLELSFFSYLFLFSFINSVLEETLWRGILLTRMVELAGEKAAVLFSGLAFGMSHLAFGYSILTCLGFSIGGFFYAGLVIRSGTIIPAIIWHFIFNILMILSGIIPYIS